jgi:hypothetical protein
MNGVEESASVAGLVNQREIQGFEVPVDVQDGCAVPWYQSFAGVCLRRAKADSPFPNDGPRNSIQHFRTRKMAATILRQWRNR